MGLTPNGIVYLPPIGRPPLPTVASPDRAAVLIDERRRRPSPTAREPDQEPCEEGQR
jgi:hypothetical protein